MGEQFSLFCFWQATLPLPKGFTLSVPMKASVSNLVDIGCVDIKCSALVTLSLCLAWREAYCALG